MSVEDYLNSIRKNTASTSSHSEKLSDTMRELLNYETLKKSISAGVEKGNREQFKRLSELSKKILSTSEATSQELREINLLLKMFYAQIPKNNQGNTQVSAESWVKALKEVLDEFGDSLPDKFRNRLKYDIVGTAAQAGADPKQVFQQLNVTQVNQTMVLQNIYAEMKEQQLLIERKAEAEKPVKQQKERNNENFWQTRMGGVLDKLTKIADHVLSAGKWLGLIYVGLGIFSQLSENAKNIVRSLGALPALMGAIPRLMTAMNSLKGLDAIKAIGNNKVFRSIGNMAKSAGSAIKTAGTDFLWNTKLGNGLLNIATNPVLTSITKSLQSLPKYVGSVLKMLEPVKGIVVKVLPVLSGIFRKLVWPVTVIYDFIDGFASSNGSTHEKIMNGLKNVVHKFIQAIASIPSWIIKGLFKAWDHASAYFKKGLPAVGKDIMNGLVFLFKEVFSVLTLPLSTLLGEIIARIKDEHPNVAKFLQSAKNLVDKTLPSAPASGGLFSGGSASMAPGITDSVTGTRYVGKDTMDAMLPLNAASYGRTLPTAEGINKKSDVIISGQTADFYKRAGLTNKITSGMEGKHAGTASNPRSHYSGNKFDLDISTTSAVAFANEVRKMLKTPGLVEIRTESVPRSVVEGARAILKKEGLDTSRLINDGYPSYSTGPHLDVLIDPKYSGVSPTNAKLATSTKNLEGSSTASDIPSTTKEDKNPMIAQLETQLTKAFSEQVKMLEKGVKAPDQLASAQTKASTSAIVGQLGSQSSGGAITFNKKNDIQDASLVPFRFTEFA